VGPTANAPSDNAINGRAGIYPARYQSDAADHAGPLVSRANRGLRYVIPLIAENLLKCNEFFHDLGETWQAAGTSYRAVVVRAAKRFCRIAYQMVAGRRVVRQPSGRERHYILEKLSTFYTEHETPLDQVRRDLHEAANWLPRGEYATEAERLRAGLPPAPRSAAPPAAARPHPAARPPISVGRPRGPRPLSAILPGLLLRLGDDGRIERVRGGRPHLTADGLRPEQRLPTPWRIDAFDESVALCRITRTPDAAAWGPPLMNQCGEW